MYRKGKHKIAARGKILSLFVEEFLPSVPDFQGRCFPRILSYAASVAPLEDSLTKPCAYQLQYSAQGNDEKHLNLLAALKLTNQLQGGIILTLILLTSRWLMQRWVLIRQCFFLLRFLTTFTVNLWFGMWTASRSSPLTIVGPHHPTRYGKPKKDAKMVKRGKKLRPCSTTRNMSSKKCIFS